ncbi:hypothetical protein MHTCC0001_25200 [Flavobacteriaceae bacterium MHTCC 0001]
MKIIKIIIVLLASVTLPAQNYSFGKVSKEELKEEVCLTDSSAVAAYLYKDRYTYIDYNETDGFVLNTKIHERIKIYNKEGFNYATKTVALFKNSSGSEVVHGLKASTYNLVEGKIEVAKLKKDGVFKTELSKYYNQTKFTMPNIKAGSVIEYKYEIKSPFYSNVDVFEFQHAIPIKKLEAKFAAPEYFVFKSNIKGFLSIKPKKSSRNDKINFVNRQRNLGAPTTFSSSSIDYVESIDNYSLLDIPALKQEPHVNNIRNYRSAVKYELSYTKFPNSTLKYYSTTWEDVVKTIYKSSTFGEELNKTGYFESDIDALLEGVSEPMQKAVTIFNYVKTNVKWDGYYGKYTGKGVRKAYKEHNGNVAEINLMLTSMLRYAGLNANPVLVSTRQNGIPLFPTREGYDYVVCGFEMPNDVILLDATGKYNAPNILPFRALNWKGRVIRKSGSSTTIDLYPKSISKNTVHLFAKLDMDGSLQGQMRSIKTGHKARNYRNSYNDVGEDEFIENIENRFDGMEISEFSVTNNSDLSKPVTEICKFSIESQADVINDKIYFSPLLFFKTTENPFKLEKREFPVDFGYPSDTIYRFNINIPEGYKIESMPESKILQLSENLGAFTYKIKAVGQSVQLIIDSKINSALISPIYYDALKAYFSDLIETQNEQIVLTKA